MTPAPTRDTAAGRAYTDLRNLARRDGSDPAAFFTLYGLEGFLARLAASAHADDNDGLVFDPASVRGEPIRDDAEFTGVRVRVAGSLATAQLALHVDVNFGDPIWPAPAVAELPLLLGGALRLRGYPDHRVLAEKIVAAVDRGDQNMRWRDFVDVAAIAHVRQIRYADVRTAVETVARYRQVSLQPLATLLERMPDLAQRKCATWRRRQRLDTVTPERFGELLDVCITFADPVLVGSAEGQTWDPVSRRWGAALTAD